MREKLIELIDEAEEHSTDICVYTSDCKDCPGRKYRNKCREYLKADHLIANGVTVQEWISVKDRLPDKHDIYLCNVKAFSFLDLRYFAILKYDDGGFIEGKIYTDDVTHWMPLPQPPKGE